MNTKFRTLSLAIQLYKECMKLQLPFYLQDQLNRAASSVALNLSEGRAKRTLKDQRKFFYIAYGSLKEVQTILKMVETSSNLSQLADITAAHLYKLINSIKL